MANANASRLGDINAGGSVFDSLFLEVFSGLVLERFDFTQITDERQTERKIKDGKSAQFPLIWSTEAGYHTAGVELVGQDIKHNAKTIAIEKLLCSDVFVDVLDEAMNHYDVRAPYAHQLGESLANAKDKNTFRAIFAGAAASGLIDSFNDGTVIQTAALSTTPALMKAAMYDIAQTFDEKNVPATDRYAALLPLAWYLLLEDGEFIHRDFAGEGSKAHATMPFAADLQVHKSNNIPTANDTSEGTVPSVLRDDFRECIGVGWHKTSIGTVKLLDLKTEAQYDVRRQGTLLVAKYAIGQNWLRTEACVSLEDTSIV